MWHFSEGQSQQFLVNAERDFNNMIKRKVLLRHRHVRAISSELELAERSHRGHNRKPVRGGSFRDHLDCLVIDAVLGLENLVMIEGRVVCLNNDCILAALWKLTARLQMLHLGLS